MNCRLSGMVVVVLVMSTVLGCSSAGEESGAQADTDPGRAEATADGASSTTGSSSTSTSTTAAGRDCGVDFAGQWEGTWQSLGDTKPSGTAHATIEVEGTTVTGSLSLSPPEGITLLLDSGPVSGTIDCADLHLSVADDLLTLDGIIDSDGITFQGTYDANLDGGASADSGRFTMTRIGLQQR